MYYRRIFRDAGEGAGSAPAAPGTDGTGVAAPSPGSAPAGDGGKGTHSYPDGTDFKAMLLERDTELAQSKKQVGDQGNEIGKLRSSANQYDAIAKAFKEDPQEAHKMLGERFGVSLATKPEDPLAQFNLEGIDEKTKKALTQAFQQQGASTKAAVMSEVTPVLNALQVESLRAQYPDWDARAELREEFKTAHVMKALPGDQIYHLAAIGASQAQILKDHDAVVREKVYAEIAAKQRDGMPDGGGGHGKPGPTGDGEKPMGLAERVKQGREKANKAS